MKRVERLRTNRDFKRALRGRRVASSAFVLHTGSTETPSSSGQVGFIVSKSVGNSVVRHRVTRQLRAIISPRVSRLNPADRFVVRALPAITTLPYSQLEAEIEAALITVGRA
ncbi:MAG: ribonuclease P protein component [Actinobacteria bacterium]|jgi:ribonuclease P protein component|nr:ribonuclease P protein component [Actinomycetota bacterium]NBP91005.1 ribonuclease P protein component [Actinomycetota bacterium]